MKCIFLILQLAFSISQTKHEKDFSGFYFVEGNLKNFTKITSIQIRPSDILNPTLACLYLNNNEYFTVNKFKSLFVLRPLSPEEKLIGVTNNYKSSSSNPILLEDNTKYIIKTHSSFQPSPFDHLIYPNYYISSQPNISNPLIQYIQPFQYAQLLNRWTSSIIQKDSMKIDFSNQFYRTERPFHLRGYKGNNVIITIVDSGIDTSSCYFYDPNTPLPINKTNYNHRKIVHYHSYADIYDTNGGHGTHVAGTAVGSAINLGIYKNIERIDESNNFEENSYASLYNGIATNAKLLFVDAGIKSKPSVLVSYDFDEVLNISKDVGSTLFSNSWGFDSEQFLLKQVFNSIAYDNPNITFLFACGNGHSERSLMTPGDAKNIISVGGANPSKASNLLDKSSNVKFSLLINFTDAPEEFPISPKFDLSKNLLQSHQSFSYSKLLLHDSPSTLTFLEQYEPVFRVIQTSNELIQELHNTKSQDYILIPPELAKGINEQDRLFIISNLSFFSRIKSQNESFLPVSLIPQFVQSFVNNPTVASYSSWGPSLDGLPKPDILSPGQHVSVNANSKYCGYAGLILKSGSSMATAAAAGGVAILMQYINEHFPHITITSPLVKALLIASAKEPVLDNSYSATNPSYGFGQYHLNRILPLSKDEPSLFICPSQEILENTVYSTTFVQKKQGVLKFAIAWLDPVFESHSSLIITPPIFADLDLTVLTPNNTVIHGNQHKNGYEDSRNTAERVVLEDAPPGTYKIFVRCGSLSLNYPVNFSAVAYGYFQDPENSSKLSISSNSQSLKNDSEKQMKENQETVGEFSFEKTDECVGGCNEGKCIKGFCKCPDRKSGSMCQFESLKITDQLKINLQSREPVVLYLKWTPNNENSILKIYAKSIFYDDIIQMEVSEGSETKYGGHFLGYRQMKHGQININLNQSLFQNISETIKITLYLATNSASNVLVYFSSSNNLWNVIISWILSILMVFFTIAIISLVIYFVINLRKTPETDSSQMILDDNQIMIEISSDSSNESDI